MLDKSTTNELSSKDKGKAKEFTPFVVGGLTIENAIDIVESGGWCWRWWSYQQLKWRMVDLLDGAWRKCQCRGVTTSTYVLFVHIYMYRIASKMINLGGCAKTWDWVYSITPLCQVFWYDGGGSIELWLDFSRSWMLTLRFVRVFILGFSSLIN